MTKDKNFDYAFGLNKKCLALIGLWPRIDRKIDKFKELMIPIIMLFFHLGLFLPCALALTQVYRNLSLVIDNFIISCTTVTSYLKIFIIWNSRRVLERVMNMAMDDWTSDKLDWELKIMKKQASRARLFTISGYVIMLICFIGFITAPFFGLSIRIINNITDPLGKERYFPFQTYYPYDWKKSPYYELTYLTQLVAGTFIGLSFSSLDNYFGALCFHACAQSEILKIKFKKIIIPSGDYNRYHKLSNKNERELWRIKLRQCVETHVNLVRFVDAIEMSFNKLVLVEVICLSVIMACLGVSVVKSFENKIDNIPIVQIITLTGTLFNLLIHMLVYCVASQILTDHSQKFCQSIYSSDWQILPTSCSRDIVILMIRSQFPLRLTGKFFTLSLNTYINVIKNAMAYISMLLAVGN